MPRPRPAMFLPLAALATALVASSCSAGSSAGSEASTTVAAETSASTTQSGSSPAEQTPTEQTPAEQAPVDFEEFDLGDVTYTAETGTEITVRQRGTITTPDVPAASAPVVFIISARTRNYCSASGEAAYPCPEGETEIRYEAAYENIATSLTNAGNVVVTLDSNSIHFVEDVPPEVVAVDDGAKRATMIIDTVLGAMESPEDSGLPAGPVAAADTSRIELIGHSNGGQIVFNLVEPLEEAGHSVSALVAIAPVTDDLGTGQEAIINRQDIPTLIIVGTKDEDTGLSGLTLFDPETAGPREHTVTWVTALDATHLDYAKFEDGELEHTDSWPPSIQRRWAAEIISQATTQLLADAHELELTSDEMAFAQRSIRAGQTTVVASAGRLLDYLEPFGTVEQSGAQTELGDPISRSDIDGFPLLGTQDDFFIVEPDQDPGVMTFDAGRVASIDSAATRLTLMAFPGAQDVGEVTISVNVGEDVIASQTFASSAFLNAVSPYLTVASELSIDLDGIDPATISSVTIEPTGSSILIFGARFDHA